MSKQDVLDALADPEGRKLLAQAVLGADIVQSPGNPPDPKNPTWAAATYLRLIYGECAAIRASFDPAKLAAAITKALPAGQASAQQLEAAVEAGVRAVFADAGSGS